MLDLFKAHFYSYVKKSPDYFREPLLWTFSNSAKFLRPMIVLSVASSLCPKYYPLDAALSLELLHIASCVLDDLPSMDDTLLRKGKKTLHLAFGEAKAILLATGLISESYALLSLECQKKQSPIAPENRERAESFLLRELSSRGGLHGAVYGQWIDLFEKKDSLRSVEKMIYLKTASLFELAFVFGWVLGGGGSERLFEMAKAGYHLGFALQTADDLLDWEEDLKRGGEFNLIFHLGKEGTLQYMENHLDLYDQIIKDLDLDHPYLKDMRSRFKTALAIC